MKVTTMLDRAQYLAEYQTQQIDPLQGLIFVTAFERQIVHRSMNAKQDHYRKNAVLISIVLNLLRLHAHKINKVLKRKKVVTAVQLMK